MLFAAPGAPIFADPVRFFKSGTVPCRPNLRRGFLVLHYLHAQSLRNMLSNVAMHQPCSWVVGFEGNHDVSLLWQDDYVSSWRVLFVQYRRAGIERCIVCLRENGKIVAVQVDLGHLISTR